MHIGLIAGIGPAATDFYYRGLIERHAAAGLALDLTMVHADVRKMARNLADKNPRKQAEIFAGLIERMKKAGAEVAAVTSMGGHFCINELLPISPLPLVNGIPAVAAAIAKSGFKKIGVLGTRTVMQSGLYGTLVPPALVTPDGPSLDQVHETYSAMAGSGRVTELQREIFWREARRLMSRRGAQAVMLGGTDLFLAFAGREPEFPVIDCADIHVDAIFQKSSGGNP
ncbi:MAG TPA: aspartate/glutamate racemase family protein [Reyranella sp.]|jgi:aspartate racemase|nr:aspartate/glutamate racemase family protein [Reyranella sp.]